MLRFELIENMILCLVTEWKTDFLLFGTFLSFPASQSLVARLTSIACSTNNISFDFECFSFDETRAKLASPSPLLNKPNSAFSSSEWDGFFSFSVTFVQKSNRPFSQDWLNGIENVGRVEKESRVWLIVATTYVIRRTRWQALNATNNLSADYSIRYQSWLKFSSLLPSFSL